MMQLMLLMLFKQAQVSINHNTVCNVNCHALEHSLRDVADAAADAAVDTDVDANTNTATADAAAVGPPRGISSKAGHISHSRYEEQMQHHLISPTSH